jgi:hypothetical protein
MLTCPLCKNELPAPAPRCPRCQADLTLLADYMSDLRSQLDRADSLRRAGDLAPAVQAYLDVLDVDPTNAEARAALGPVLRAVRAAGLARDRRSWAASAGLLLAGALIALTAFAAGYWLAHSVVL